MRACKNSSRQFVDTIQRWLGGVVTTVPHWAMIVKGERVHLCPCKRWCPIIYPVQLAELLQTGRRDQNRSGGIHYLLQTSAARRRHVVVVQCKFETNTTLMIVRYVKIVCIVLNFYRVVIDKVGVEFSLLKRTRIENCNAPLFMRRNIAHITIGFLDQ